MKDENGQMILTHRGGGSGGYLDYVFRSAAKELFNIDTNDQPLEFKTTRYKSLFFYYFKLMIVVFSLLEIKIFVKQC